MAYMERGSGLKERQGIAAQEHDSFSALDLGVRCQLRVRGEFQSRLRPVLAHLSAPLSLSFLVCETGTVVGLTL